MCSTIIGLASKTCSPANVLDAGFKPPFVIDRTENIQPVSNARDIVVITMAGSRMNAAGAGIKRDIIRKHEKRFPIDEWMAGFAPFKRFPTESCNFPG